MVYKDRITGKLIVCKTQVSYQNSDDVWLAICEDEDGNEFAMPTENLKGYIPVGHSLGVDVYAILHEVLGRQTAAEYSDKIETELQKKLIKAADVFEFERNMIALHYADGWFEDAEAREGWKRALSLGSGKFTVLIPDDFDIGNLIQIDMPDVHRQKRSREEEWEWVRKIKGITSPISSTGS